MSNLLPCTGCKFLITIGYPHLASRCSATDGNPQNIWNAYTERFELKNIRLRPRVEEQRSPRGACKPERLLYQPSWAQRFVDNPSMRPFYICLGLFISGLVFIWLVS